MINKAKKILFVGKRSYNNLGCYDFEYLQRLNKSKLNTSIFYACSNLYDQKLIREIKYLKIFKYNNLHIINKCFSYIYSLLTLLKYIKKYIPDVIHLQWLLFPFIDLIWIKSLKLIRWKGLIVITIHNAKSRQSLITNYFLKNCYRQIDHFVVHSSMCSSYLLSKYNFIKSDSIFEGRHGLINLKNHEILDNDELKIYSKICETRKKYKNIYLYIGNLSKYKGFDLLIASWNKYRENTQDNKNSALFILGRAEKSMLKLLTENNLHHNGIVIHNSFVSDKLISLTVNKSDYILLLHRYISHSGIYSSLLSKCKPFIYNNNKNNHMLSHPYFKKTGIQFNNDEDSLSNLFLKIENENINFKCNSSQWAKAIDYFSWEKSFPDKLLKSLYNL